MGLTTSDLTFELAGHVVNRVGLGAKRLLRDDSYTPGDRDSAIAVLRRAVELGVNHIDTALIYFSRAGGRPTS